jgi:uncharacterized protein
MPRDDFELSNKSPIFDNVHGFIHLTDLEWEIINSPPFQRLRNIKQLGLTHLVFPGATHTRFSHSIGVLHIASMMVESLERRYKTDFENLDIEKDLVRLAALLHDIGHYPLSHTIEGIVKGHTNSLNIPCPDEIEIVDNRITENIIRIQNSESHKLNCKIHRGGRDYANHERLATLVIFKTEIYGILKKYQLDDNKIKGICQIITGQYPGNENSFIHSELDADRFDYLLRDSYNTGVSYGKFDLYQIIRHLDFQLYADPHGDEQTSTGLVIRKKGQRAVEDYLISRYFLYSTVMYQKANIGFHKMMDLIYKGLMERGKVYSYGDIVNFFDTNHVDNFLFYNDVYLDTILQKIQRGEIKLDAGKKYEIGARFLNDLINRFLKREPLKSVINSSSIRTVSNSNEPWNLRQQPILNDIGIRAGVRKHWIISSEIVTGITKVNPKLFLMPDVERHEILREKIKVYDPEEASPNNIFLLIEDEASLIRELKDKELVIRNLYTNDEVNKSKLKRYLDNHVFSV